MRVRVIALAVPLAVGVGMGCSTSRSQARGSGGEPSASSGAPSSDTSSTTAQGSTPSSGAQGSQGALDPLMKPGPAIKAHASDEIVSGEIGDVSSDQVSIQSAQGDTKTLEIVPQTSITVNGRDATYADLEEGQQVRASFNQVEGRDVAVEIQIGAAPSDAGSGSAHGTGSTESGSSGASSPDGSSTPGGSSDTSGSTDTHGHDQY